MIYKHLLYGTLGCLSGHLTYLLVSEIFQKLKASESRSNASSTLVIAKKNMFDFINIGSIVGCTLGMLMTHRTLLNTKTFNWRCKQFSYSHIE